MTVAQASSRGIGSDTARGAWYVMLLLCLLYGLSFIDRLILALLTVDVGRDLQVSDSQLGLLMGTSFAIVYAIGGLPIAHFLDRGNRKRIVVAGVLLWSTMTILSAFAQGFAILAICRGGVALGEAVLSPAAISLIGDLFPRERRVLPTSCYVAVGAVMAIGAFAFDGVAVDLARSWAPALHWVPWRLTLVVVGAPGIILGLLFAVSVREPVRERTAVSPSGGDDASFTEFRRYLVGHRGIYVPLYTAMTLIFIYFFAVMTWTPTLLVRAHGMTASEAGYAFGLLGIAGGLLGTLAWPRLAVGLGRRGHRESTLLALLVGCLIGWPFMAIAPALAGAVSFLAGVGAIIFTGTVEASLLPLVIQEHGPPRMRARLMSLLYLAQSLLGYGTGPLLVATIAKVWGSDPLALGYALVVTGTVCVPATAVCYALCRRALLRRSS